MLHNPYVLSPFDSTLPQTIQPLPCDMHHALASCILSMLHGACTSTPPACQKSCLRALAANTHTLHCIAKFKSLPLASLPHSSPSLCSSHWMGDCAIEMYKVTHPIPDPPLFPTPISTIDPVRLNSESSTSIFKNRK